MAKSKRLLWNKVGRYFSAIVIAAFFLPFFGVSCDGMDVITVSGADMVGGCKPGGMITDMADESERHGGGGGMAMKHGDDSMGGLDVTNVEREPIAIIALVLAVGLFGAAWLKNQRGVAASFGLSLALAGALIALYVKVGGELREAVEKEKMPGKAEGMKHDVKVDAGGRYGLWLELLLLGSMLVITGRALRERDDAPAAPMPAAPPA